MGSHCQKTFTIPAGAVELVSIEVLPANPGIDPTDTQQFQAIGHYTDSSTLDITTSVTWNSATPATATIDALGLATGVAVGTSVISATLGAISGNTTLTVNFNCGVNPTTFAAMTWTYAPPPGLGPPCVDETLTGNTGTWTFTFNTTTCLSLQDSVDASATICNPGADYAFTVTIPWTNSGAVNAGWPFHDITFRLEVNGILQEQVAASLLGAPVSPVVLHGTIPGFQTSTIRLYFVMAADPTPSVNANGTIVIA